MPEYAGEFEMHLTVRAPDAGDLERFRAWCAARGFKCVQIVLARGACVQQPLATWHRAGTTLSAMRQELETCAAEAKGAGLVPVRLKIEAGLHNAEVPADDTAAVTHPPANYFEHHLKLLRPVGAPREALTQLCQRHGAHLSQNALRRPRDGQEERFVTLRSYRQGRTISLEQLANLRAALAQAGEEIVEIESEYCVYDSNLALDAGWLNASG